MDYDIYISSNIKKDFNEVVNIADHHNSGIEIKAFTKDRVMDNLDKVLPAYKKMLTGFKGKLSMHAVFGGLNPVADSIDKREKTAKKFNRTLEIAKTLNVKTIVFHSGFDNFNKKLFEDQEFIRDFIEKEVTYWKGFAKYLNGTDIVAVIENTSEKSPYVLLEVVNRVASGNLKLCIDTGHVNHKTTYSLVEWIKKSGNKLHHMHLHLHNNYGILDDHSSLLRGTINFKEVFKTLKEENLKPGLCLEINDYGQSMESLRYIRSIE